MKPFLLAIFILSMGISQKSLAQRFGVMDTQKVLESMPEYKEAIKVLNEKTTEWNDELKKKQKELQELKKIYASERILLKNYERKLLAQKLKDKETEVKEYQEKIFGYKGAVYQKRIELIVPARKKLEKTVKLVAKRNRMNIVFDKYSSVNFIILDSEYDITELVLEEIAPEEEDDK